MISPSLLLNEDICKANIKRMADKANNHGLVLKPHMKTHQSAEIGEWIREEGIQAITVSSIQMAQYFADAGWDDITIAFPAHNQQSATLNNLASRVNLTILLNNKQTVKFLDEHLKHPINTYVEIDTGAKRTGIPSGRISQIDDVVKAIGHSSLLTWTGFYSHPGHSYQARSVHEIRDIHQSVLKQCRNLRDEFKKTAEDFEICIGDTPCCSVGEDFDGIDAISPGNFVFFDLMQNQIGSCDIEDIAVAMACPVVDLYPERSEIAIHGGAVHFSKEQINSHGLTHYGLVANHKEKHWEISKPHDFLVSLSQEHGIVKCSPYTIDQYTIGDIVYILPVHSCLTANLMKRFRINANHTIELMEK